jgi:uncharacterized protein YqiB (DUF1249 family)
MKQNIEDRDIYRTLFNLRNGCTKQESHTLYQYLAHHFVNFTDSHKIITAEALATVNKLPNAIASLVAAQPHHISRHFLSNKKSISLDTIIAAVNTNFSQEKLSNLLQRNDLSQEAISLLLPLINKYIDLITLITHNCDNFSTNNIAKTITLHDKYHIYLHLFSKHRNFNQNGFEDIIAKLSEDIRENLLSFIENYSFFKYIAQVAEQEKLKKENYKQIDELFATNKFEQEMLLSFIKQQDIDSLTHYLANLFDLPASSLRQLLAENNFDLCAKLLRHGISGTIASKICDLLL